MTVDNFGEREYVFFLRLWLLVGQQYSRRWPQNHEYMGIWAIQVRINRKKEKEEEEDDDDDEYNDNNNNDEEEGKGEG